MDNNLSFAVIIPVYNAGDYIAECLDSLIAQTYRNWIAYCVDDGSIDSSSIILDDYQNRDKRIRVFHIANGGVASARNYALDRLEGEQWVSFVDADDYISPFMFESIVEGLANSGNPSVDYIRLFPSKTERRYSEIKTWRGSNLGLFNNRVVSSKDYFREENVGGFVASLAVKSSIIQTSGIRFVETMRILEDQVFSIECATHAKSVLIHNEECYYYYSNPASSTRSAVDRSNDIIQCINRIMAVLGQSNDEVLKNYFRENFLPVKMKLLLKERIKHFFSPLDFRLSSSFNIKDYEFSHGEYTMYFFLKIFNKI